MIPSREVPKNARQPFSKLCQSLHEHDSAWVHDRLCEKPKIEPPLDYDPMSHDDHDPLNLDENLNECPLKWAQGLILTAIAIITLLVIIGTPFLLWLIYKKAF